MPGRSPGRPSATAFEVLRNDVDPDSTSGLKVVGARLTEGTGSVTLAGNVVTMSPPPDLVGVMVASYTIEDADGLTATRIGASHRRATAATSRRSPPTTAPRWARASRSPSTCCATTVTLTTTRSTLDAAGRAAGRSATAVGGRVRSITFRAGRGVSGTAEIGYQISDGVAAADATLRVEVHACEAALPEAPDVSLFTGYRQPLSIDLTTYARNGTVSSVGPPLGAPTGTYTPPAGENGNVSFEYVVKGCLRPE